MAPDFQKSTLIAELALSRIRISKQWVALRRDLNFPAQAKKIFSSHPGRWISGAAFLGLLMAKLPSRTKKVVVDRKGREKSVENAGKAGLLLGGLKLALDFARPALTAWVTKRVSDYSTGQWKAGPTRR